MEDIFDDLQRPRYEKALVVMEYDERHSTIELRHRKTDSVIMKIKLEAVALGTMNRAIDAMKEGSDADNYWMGVKPADSVVFEDGLFTRKQLVVKSINFDLTGKK